MKALRHIRPHAQARDLVNWDATTDHFQIGDPQTEVKAVAVAWQARLDTIRKAHEARLQHVHQPTQQFEVPQPQVARRDEKQPMRSPSAGSARSTGSWLIRCHDVWDACRGRHRRFLGRQLGLKAAPGQRH